MARHAHDAPDSAVGAGARPRGRAMPIDDRDHEQHDAETDQRGAVHAVGLAELVGDHGGHRSAGRESVAVIAGSPNRRPARPRSSRPSRGRGRSAPRRRCRCGCAGTPRRGSSPSGSRRARRPLPSAPAARVANTSRVSDVMIGVIMIATTRPAVMKLSPLAGGAENSVSRTGCRRVRREIDCRSPDGSAGRASEPPEPEHDRRHRREQVDDVDDRPAQPPRRRPR